MIGGNITAQLQKRSTTRNELGEQEKAWQTVQEISGFIDLMAGGTKYDSYNAKIQESTHVFISDYVPVEVEAEEARAVINGKVYDITLIDNPMELNKHLEIYLKFTGGQ